MEPENLALSLGAQAAAALTVLTMARCTLPFPDRIPAMLRAAAKSARRGRLWTDMMRRRPPATGTAG